jgi:hypothetical protein
MMALSTETDPAEQRSPKVVTSQKLVHLSENSAGMVLQAETSSQHTRLWMLTTLGRARIRRVSRAGLRRIRFSREYCSLRYQLSTNEINRSAFLPVTKSMEKQIKLNLRSNLRKKQKTMLAMMKTTMNFFIRSPELPGFFDLQLIKLFHLMIELTRFGPLSGRSETSKLNMPLHLIILNKLRDLNNL